MANTNQLEGVCVDVREETVECVSVRMGDAVLPSGLHTDPIRVLLVYVEYIFGMITELKIFIYL